MISLLSGNSYLWQWNTGQRVILDDAETATAVSFSVDEVTAIRREVCDSGGEKYAEIPNILLQTAGMLYVYVHHIEGNQLTTVLEAIYQIRSQPKLPDYVNDEQETLFWHQLDERITALENGSSTGGGGLTPRQAKALDEMFKICAFTVPDAGEQYSIFRKAFGLIKGIPATRITLSAQTISFHTSSSQKLTASVEPPDSTDNVVWESSNNQVATVHNGLVTPVGNGDAVITAKAGNVSAQCSVNVEIVGARKFAVTNNLTNCKSNNQASEAIEGSSYTAKITANEGYTLDGADVTVMMNGIVITDTAYSDGGAINVPNVIGDITISVAAVSASSDVVLGKSVMTDGVAWIDTGWIWDQWKYRLEYGVEFGSFEGSYPYLGANMYNIGSAYGKIGVRATASTDGTGNQEISASLLGLPQIQALYTNGKQITGVPLHNVISTKKWQIYNEESHTTQPSYPWYRDVDYTVSPDESKMPIQPIALFKMKHDPTAHGSETPPVTGTKFYYFRVYDETNESLVIDLRPAKMGGRVGMYDEVKKEFHPAQDGTLTFEEA